MIPVSAPPRVRSLLLATPDGSTPVVHRGREALYVAVAGWCVGVLSRRATAVPCGLRTLLDAMPEVGAVRVFGGVLHLDDEPLPVGRLVDVSVPRLALPRQTAPLAPPGDIAAMVGRGDGLTPYDDDVLCGWLAAHRAAGVATPEVDAEIRRHLDRTTLLSATLLDCAMRGETIPELAAWLTALGGAREDAAAATLVGVGHTSGRGLLHGARLALDALTSQQRCGMTHTHVEVRPGAYADSVTLLQVSRAVQGLSGVVAAQVAMATALNVDVLAEMGFEVPAAATTNDLIVALRVDCADVLADALAGVAQALRDAARRSDDGPSEVAPPRTTASALRRTPDATVLVTVPGPSALVEAMDAVDAGRDVMVFSDNVPLEQEVALKRAAAERGVLVMGPDCGTAVVGGLGLGFANVVPPGPVGIVAASGTGCQQLLALLDHAGVGVSSALGVGGRDLSAGVGGLATREALRRLDEDPAVALIVLVSKPPAPEVAADIAAYAAGLATPVELALLGPGQPDLTAAAEAVLRRLGRDVPAWPVAGGVSTSSTNGGAGLIRGLFVGGTLRSEAQLIAGAPHTFVDFGDDEYTSGRAHPMIDPSLRLEHLARAAADPQTGVLLLDVVLGHGAEPDPAAALAPAIDGIEVPVIVAVIGTGGDLQGRDRQVQALVDAGAEVHLSNAGATRRALELIGAGS